MIKPILKSQLSILFGQRAERDYRVMEIFQLLSCSEICSLIDDWADEYYVDYFDKEPEYEDVPESASEASADTVTESSPAKNPEFALEEAEELIPLPDNPLFSMTAFAENQEIISELEAEPEPAIIEENGVFKIAENLSYTDILLDPEFKLLVDSVLR